MNYRGREGWDDVRGGDGHRRKGERGEKGYGSGRGASRRARGKEGYGRKRYGRWTKKKLMGLERERERIDVVAKRRGTRKMKR